MPEPQLCIKCGESKQVNEYSVDKRYNRPMLRCKKCRCASTQACLAANPDYAQRQIDRLLSPGYIQARHNNYRNSTTSVKLFRGARERARKRGTMFSISKEDIIVPTCCPCCKTILTPSKGKMGVSSPSLDRIDNNLGYVSGNVWVICFRCNALKGDSTPSELRNIAIAVEDRLNGK